MGTNRNDTLVIIPAWNEEETIGFVLNELSQFSNELDVLVVNDGSVDGTGEVARAFGVFVLSAPFNMGIGGAIRIGFRYALENGYRCAVQVDADGQHVASQIGKLTSRLTTSEKPQLVIGSRFGTSSEYKIPLLRRFAMRLLSMVLSRVTRTSIKDASSGFRAYNRSAIELFARHYPTEYLIDVVESTVMISQVGGTIQQVDVAMRARLGGEPSHSSWKSLIFLARVIVYTTASLLQRPTRPGERTEDSEVSKRGDS
jgi:glycosyltransferase involved in cell wall biosynthesis